jgi:hypothetical protein
MTWLVTRQKPRANRQEVLELCLEEEVDAASASWAFGRSKSRF